ncbi:3-oxoacyl-ACP synthase III family protein [Clostridium saccharoperbutylacetonicum]
MPLTFKESVIVTGSRLVKNDYFLEHFKKRGQDLEHFLVDILGRNERYHCENLVENTLTLGAKAVDEVLVKSKLTGKDIDMIIFCSQYPEFTVPSQACIIHNHIRGKEKCVTLDMNANCLGMLRGLDIINRYFNDKNGEIRKALLIGSDYMSIHTKEDDAVTYSSFSDGACAIVLEYTNEEGKGVIGSADRTLSKDTYGCLFPECGMANISKYLGESVKTSWTNPDIPPVIASMKDALYDVLEKHNLSVNDIDWYCGSQFTISFFDGIREACGIPKEKGIYVGDKYGYTGTSSPFFSYTQGVVDGKIKKGDLVFFTTVGVGHTICSMLVRV